LNHPWYAAVNKESPLDQGELVMNCPVVAWKQEIDFLTDTEDHLGKIRAGVEAIKTDVVVMTQTCDLAENKVACVILCPHYSLEEYRTVWEEDMKANGQNPKDTAWAGWLNRIVAGQIWNLSMINNESGEGYRIDHRIVDFHEVFSLPRDYLESWVRKSPSDRIKLLPPYREHLSQAFARFFMRVGFPSDISKVW